MKRIGKNVATLLCRILIVLWGTSAAIAASQEPSNGDKLAHAAEHRNMQLVGTHDLQSRSTYQPTIHKYPDGRYILFAGHHALANQGENQFPNGQPLPSFNSITKKNEPNGTSIVDVTDPAHPVYKAHIPVGTTGNGGAQMVRACDGSQLNVSAGEKNHVFMLRSYANSAHEIWDVTEPSTPVGVRTVTGGNPVIGADTGEPAALAGTHKSWWECDTGIAYIVGRRGNDTANGWGGGNHIFIFDLSNPHNPVFLRDWALHGQQPPPGGGTPPPHYTSTPSIHGPISTGPDSASNPIKGTGATVNRVYFAYGTSSNGAMQVVDRSKLLPPPFGSGSKCGSAASTLDPPSCATADFTSPEVGLWTMIPYNGSHTSFPIGTIAIPDFAPNASGTVRDFVVVTSEETFNQCTGPRNLTYMVEVTEDVTGETGTRPQSQANFGVPESDGNFCDRGGRFGPHATNEEFGPPFYQKIVFVSYFNGGVRAIDVRDPFNPVEVGFYIPATNENTDFRCATINNQLSCKIAIQTNNVATDDRGYIYIVDRANTGLHVLQLTGPGLDPLK